MLLVEQHVHLALEVADRAYVLSHGNLVLEGSAAELSANRHLLESSYLGQSEIAAAEEEQEEIEEREAQAGAVPPAGDEGPPGAGGQELPPPTPPAPPAPPTPPAPA